eukprot:g373.t1
MKKNTAASSFYMFLALSFVLVLFDEAFAATMQEEYFTQKLDHFGGIFEQRTWKQRFWYDDSAIEKFENRRTDRIPVMLCFPGIVWDLKTSDQTPQLVCADMLRSAKENNAIAIILETRYYGRSRPTPDTSVANLKFLTSSQMVNDFITFYKFATQKWNLTSPIDVHVPPGYRPTPKTPSSLSRGNGDPPVLPAFPFNPWFLFGHGFGGTLAAWSAETLSSVVVGAIVSSAPVHASVSFPLFGQSIADVYGADAFGGSKECVEEMKRAFDVVGTALSKASSRKQYIYPVFYNQSSVAENREDGVVELDPLDSSDMQALFGEWLQLPFRFGIGSASPKNAIGTICRSLLAETKKTLLERIGSIVVGSKLPLPVVSTSLEGVTLPMPWIPFQINGSAMGKIEPLTASPAGALESARSGKRASPQAASAAIAMNASDFNGARLVLWQLCSELGWFQMCGNDQSCPFSGAPRVTSESVNIAACDVVFGTPPSSSSSPLSPSVEPIWSLDHLQDAANTINLMYGGGDPRKLRARVLWVSGEFDPWRYLSIGSLSVRSSALANSEAKTFCGREGSSCSFATSEAYPFDSNCCAGLTCQPADAFTTRFTCGGGDNSWPETLAVRGAPGSGERWSPPHAATMIVRSTIESTWIAPSTANESDEISDARDAISTVISRWIDMCNEPAPGPSNNSNSDSHMNFVAAITIVSSAAAFILVVLVVLALRHKKKWQDDGESNLPSASRLSGGAVAGRASSLANRSRKSLTFNEDVLVVADRNIPIRVRRARVEADDSASVVLLHEDNLSVRTESTVRSGVDSEPNSLRSDGGGGFSGAVVGFSRFCADPENSEVLRLPLIGE